MIIIKYLLLRPVSLKFIERIPVFSFIYDLDPKFMCVRSTFHALEDGSRYRRSGDEVQQLRT